MLVLFSDKCIELINQSINKVSIAPTSLVKPGSVTRNNLSIQIELQNLRNFHIASMGVLSVFH